MAYTITSESYGPRKPYITATATSTDDLAALGTDFAEGSTCVISTTTYKLDKVKGWIDPSQGGGSGLPEVSAADNGDVLTVVEGEWNKAAPSGGGGVLVVTWKDDDSLDKTWQEIYDAAPLVVLYYEDTDILGVYHLVEIDNQPGINRYAVTFIGATQGETSYPTFVSSSTGGYPTIDDVME